MQASVFQGVLPKSGDITEPTAKFTKSYLPVLYRYSKTARAFLPKPVFANVWSVWIKTLFLRILKTRQRSLRLGFWRIIQSWGKRTIEMLMHGVDNEFTNETRLSKGQANIKRIFECTVLFATNGD